MKAQFPDDRELQDMIEDCYLNPSRREPLRTDPELAPILTALRAERRRDDLADAKREEAGGAQG